MIAFPLSTPRMVIREFESADQPAFVQFMVDEDSTRLLNFTPEQKTPSGAEALFDFVLLAYGTRDVVHAYAIADHETNAYRGSCGFSPYEDGVVECYYCINPEFRGQGLATDATSALAQALTGQGVEVRAYCHVENTPAHKVAIGAGFKKIGDAEHKHSGLSGQVFVMPPAV